MVYNKIEINNIKEVLLAHHETLSIAESVTSGHLQAAFSLATDAKKFFQGGITAYNLGQKARHLNVEPIHAEQVDCISEKMAQTMALEVAKKFTSDYGIGITGYASLIPEIDHLFAFAAIAYQGKILKLIRLTSDVKEPYEVQVAYTNLVIKNFAALLHIEKVVRA